MPQGTHRRIGHGILDALAGLPLFATAPLYRHWHLRWGATDDEVQVPTRIGDWMPMAKNINATTAFKVKAFATNQWLLWAKPDSTWAWKLIPLVGGRTRLVSRLKARYPWETPGSAMLTLVLLEFGDFPMMRRVMNGIKARAERLNAQRSTGTTVTTGL